MPWWSWRPGHAAGAEPETLTARTTDGRLRVDPPAPVPRQVPTQREPEQSCPSSPDVSAIDREPGEVRPVTLNRVGAALDLLDVRYLADGDGSLLAMWERHAVLFTLEGPEDEILVIRARPHSTVPPDWADRAFRVVNEWNHTRRFCKAYMGDPTERGQLPIYAEMQVPLRAGAHDALLVEMVDCGAAVSSTFIEWLHDEGALL
ncbi:MAG TPA: YbjN domain-containing protein [Asanoa sp.]